MLSGKLLREAIMPPSKEDETYHRNWFADKEFKRDAAARELARETDPKKQRRLRARRDRYQAMITMGPRRTSEAVKAAQARHV
jgi:hypothetical protein